jgi:ribosomal protein L16 Arg81 hydroxylase
VNPWEPDLDRFPLFENATETDFTLYPGELLIIPRGWYHTVRALDTTMSIGFHREPVTDFGRILEPDSATLTVMAPAASA